MLTMDIYTDYTKTFSKCGTVYIWRKSESPIGEKIKLYHDFSLVTENYILGLNLNYHFLFYPFAQFHLYI